MVALENGAAAAAEKQMAGLSVANGPAQNGAIVPVGEVRSSLPRPDFAGIVAVESHTKKLGIICPPPDIRAIVDKTALFVAKHGDTYEPRILKENSNNVKFNFLRSTDPYHAYYRHRIAEVKAGGAEESAAPASEQQKAAAQKAAELAAAQPVAVTATGATKVLEAPEPEKYTVHVPEGLTLLELDLIRLVAQFVARNGKNFLTGLAGREHTNNMFNFLKPTHSLFGFFTSLCDAYSRVLMPEKGLEEKLRKDLDDRLGILERCLKRLEWEKAKEKESKEASDQLEAERLAMQSIDWHEFVVVETIDFFDDEDAELGPPVTQKDILLLNKSHPEEEPDDEAVKAAEAAAAEMDEEEKALLAEATGAAEGPPPTAQPPAAEEDVNMEVDDDEDENRQIKVVADYKRREVRAPGAEATKFVKSPITGELIRVEDMAEHMRISLIDPRYQEQREAMMAKIRDTTKASDDEIGRNLLFLAHKRPDVFGSAEEEIQQIVKNSLSERDISGSQRKPAWDGVTTSGAALQNLKADLNLREQPQQEAPKPVLGPAPGATLPPPVVRPGPPPVVLPPPPPRPAVAPTPPDKQAELMQQASAHLHARLAQQQQQAMAAMAFRPPPIIPPPMPMRPPPMPHHMMHPGMMPMGAPMPPPAPVPPSAPPPPPPPSEEEREAKRARTEFVLQPEDEFLAAHPGPSKVLIQCPDIDDNAELNGQLLAVEVASLSDSVGDLKARLQAVINLAPNKQRLTREGVGFMRDELSLGHYNVSPDIQLILSLRTRGR
eukprot:jgi/Botrbrau1/12315/Bobra.0205s0013.1